MPSGPPVTSSDLEAFLRDDLRDALKWVFVGAVSWVAHPEATDQVGVRGLGMFTTLVQARSLYEFFFERGPAPSLGGTARAMHFNASWTARDVRGLYATYMGKGTPAQKRVFHLVYGRPHYSGGTAPDESDHLKNHVRALAQDLREITTAFAQVLDPNYRTLVESALQNALQTADAVGKAYGVTLAELS